MKAAAQWLLATVAVIVAVAVVASLIGDCTECEAKGGAYVQRFTGGYECVEKKP